MQTSPARPISPPPSFLTGNPATNDFENLHFTMDPMRPSTVDPLVQFFTSLGEPPPHAELEKAIVDGDDARVLIELARLRRQISQLSPTFDTAINAAIISGRLATLDLLLKRGIPANDRNLRKAIKRGSIPMVARLFNELGRSINSVDENGYTALSLAVPHQDLTLWLLSQGADPNLQDAWAETPLSRAIECACYSAIDMLLGAVADVRQGTPLHMSLRISDERESLRLMTRLLALGAPVDKYEGEDCLFWEEAGFPRTTALHAASIKGKLGAVRILLANGADPLRLQMVGGRELMESTALDEAQGRGYMDIVSVLQGHLDKKRFTNVSRLSLL